jgi:hypothetical protein
MRVRRVSKPMHPKADEGQRDLPQKFTSYFDISEYAGQMLCASEGNPGR